MEQYSAVHWREGRSLGQPDLRKSGHLQTRGGKTSGYCTGKGKGKTSRAYAVVVVVVVVVVAAPYL